MLPADIGSGGPTGIDAEVADTGSAALDRAERGGETSWSLRMDLKGADITVELLPKEACDVAPCSEIEIKATRL